MVTAPNGEGSKDKTSSSSAKLEEGNCRSKDPTASEVRVGQDSISQTPLTMPFKALDEFYVEDDLENPIIVGQKPLNDGHVSNPLCDTEYDYNYVKCVRDLKKQGLLSTSGIHVPETSWKDMYVILIVLLLLPYLLGLYVAIAFFMFFARIPSKIYYEYSRRGGPHPYVPNTPVFYACMTFETILKGPVVIIAIGHPIFMCLLGFVVFGPVGACTGVNMCSNLRTVWRCTHVMGHNKLGIPLDHPFRFFELWRSSLGMYHRLSLWKWFLSPGYMLTMNPVVKYFMTTNIWLWQLDVTFCNQWTQAFKCEDHAFMCDHQAVRDVLISIISHYTVRKELQDKIDTACFCGHYASPLPGASPTAVGLQHSPKLAVTNLTMSTHQYLIEGAKARSMTGMTPVWAVELHYFNPWHFLTGYVEVNFQDEKLDGGAIEHPMWIIAPKGGRLGNFAYNAVNRLFEEYSPQLQEKLLDESKVRVEYQKEKE